MIQAPPAPPPPIIKEDKMAEMILVVERKEIEQHIADKGITAIDEKTLKPLIEGKAKFVRRGPAEQDPTHKQIIPYLVFHHEGKLFLTQRSDKATEKRLAGRLSLGIGGHLNESDMTGEEDSIFKWAQREFMEEVEAEGNVSPQLLGLINDESDEVGTVHTGVLWLVHLDSPNIAIKDEHVEGHLATLKECREKFDRLEPWSQMAFEAIEERLAQDADKDIEPVSQEQAQ